MPEQISQAQLDALKKYTSPEISDTIRMMGVRPATEGYLGLRHPLSLPRSGAHGWLCGHGCSGQPHSGPARAP